MGKIDDLLNIDINDLNRMTKKQLSDVVRQLSKTANQRIYRLEHTETGTLSPAYYHVEKRGENFGVKGKTLNQLRNEYTDVKKFLKMKTSTVGGWNNVRKETYKRIGANFEGIDEKRFWNLYRKLEQLDYAAVQSVGSATTQRMLRQELEQNSGDDDDILSAMEKRITGEYEKIMESYNYEDDEFFDIWEDI